MYRCIGRYKVELYHKGVLIDSVVYMAGYCSEYLMLEVLNKHFPKEYNPIEAINCLGEKIPVDSGGSYVTKVLDSTGKLIYNKFSRPTCERIEFLNGYITYTEVEAPPKPRMKPMPKPPRLGKI